MGIGGARKYGVCEPGAWSMGITAFGEILPYHENRIYLNRETKDKWGLPALEMDCEIKTNEHLMRGDMMSEAKDMLEASGIEDVETFDDGYGFGAGIHEMGDRKSVGEGKS